MEKEEGITVEPEEVAVLICTIVNERKQKL
jgi:hypothetical protein